MYYETSTYFNITMTAMDIRYQLVPPSNHIADHSERAIRTFKNQFIVVLCSVDK